MTPSENHPDGLRRLSCTLLLLSAMALLGGCANKPVAPFDYAAFKASRPASLLVLPPINDTPDVKATPAVMATAAAPLAEAGYYVFPVSLVDETFRQNGLTSPTEIQALAPSKLREIFGADAAVYMRVVKYGSTYVVIGSETRVTVEARILDLRTGAQLWSGSATASSSEQSGGSQAGLVGLLVKAIVDQVLATTMDAGFNFGAMANQRLLGGGLTNGVLYGPRSPRFQQDAPR